MLVDRCLDAKKILKEVREKAPERHKQVHGIQTLQFVQNLQGRTEKQRFPATPHPFCKIRLPGRPCLLHDQRKRIFLPHPLLTTAISRTLSPKTARARESTLHFSGFSPLLLETASPFFTPHSPSPTSPT